MHYEITPCTDFTPVECDGIDRRRPASVFVHSFGKANVDLPAFFFFHSCVLLFVLCALTCAFVRLEGKIKERRGDQSLKINKPAF